MASPRRLHRSQSGSQVQDARTTTIFVANLHCPSCIDSIQECLNSLYPRPQFVSYSIVSHSVVVRHDPSLSAETIAETLELAGFEIHSIFQDQPPSVDPVELRSFDSEWHDSLVEAAERWTKSRGKSAHDLNEDMARRQRHVENCEHCRAESRAALEAQLPGKQVPAVSNRQSEDEEQSVASPSKTSFVVVDSARPRLCKATLSVTGMTCSSCVSSITHAVEQLPWVRSIDVNLLTASSTVVFEGKHSVEEVVGTIEDCGFDVAVEEIVELGAPVAQSIKVPVRASDRWRATFAVGGMTCSSCVATLSNALKPVPWIEKADVSLVSNSATVVFLGKEHLSEIKEIIEDSGYEAAVDDITSADSTQEAQQRSIAIQIQGMFCHHCPGRITKGLTDKFAEKQTFQIEDPPLSEKKPILNIKYLPQPGKFTIRDILQTIRDIDLAFEPLVYHFPTLEERARQMHGRERKRILFRLLLSIVVAIPTFVLGIVYMSLVKDTDPVRRYLMKKMWAGNVSRLDWALFILATPVYFFAADTFHMRALKEIRAMWRPGSRTPLLQRFYRFGSMNMLLSLGTTIAYVASVVELALKATGLSSGSMSDSYFDSVVFLTMFILAGRFLEAYSKAKAGDAVSSLGKLRPEYAVLVDPVSGDQMISTDLLEIGDIVKVPYGTSPPYDGVIVEGSTNFDESSLTGESRPINKSPGDTVYSGTVNKSQAIKIRLTTISGTSMLDQIINVVREGQTRRAPVERVADIITSHFVPFVTAVAILTWLVWLILGTSGAIPRSWRDEGSGGWAFWSLRFAIAVFVVACPCGIGLAAPTALFVGGGLAAKHGILVRGGGEAFQEASSTDCVVFDKTGTLTQGGDPAVTDHEILPGHYEETVFGVVKELESNSSHPIARALTTFCSSDSGEAFTVSDVSEFPGKGLKGKFTIDFKGVTAIVGNEALLKDHGVSIPPPLRSTLSAWQFQGKSVALVALLTPPNSDTLESQEPCWNIAAAFAISDPIREDAVSTIAALKERDIDVWMLSGDNVTTAKAVGVLVGIPDTNIIAGVLPDQKAEKIKYLQRTLAKKTSKGRTEESYSRATIAMVGDGINDAPALSTADISIAMSSGSDIALSSSSFILLSPNLTTILTLLDLSRSVFRRVWFNFGWALIYNVVAMPIAAGVLYPIKTGGGNDMGHGGMRTPEKHVRLDPVWASLAMALSSVSVVMSSLALRTRIPGIGFRAKKAERQHKDFDGGISI